MLYLLRGFANAFREVQPIQPRVVVEGDPGELTLFGAGRQSVAKVEISGDDDLTARLAVRCEQTLSRHKRPAEIIVVDSLPVGPTGKIRRAALRPLLEVA